MRLLLTLSVLCLLLVNTLAEETGSYEDCYHITTSIIVAIVVGDALFTMLLLIPVYYCSRRKNKEQKKRSEQRDYINMIGKHV